MNDFQVTRKKVFILTLLLGCLLVFSWSMPFPDCRGIFAGACKSSFAIGDMYLMLMVPLILPTIILLGVACAKARFLATQAGHALWWAAVASAVIWGQLVVAEIVTDMNSGENLYRDLIGPVPLNNGLTY